MAQLLTTSKLRPLRLRRRILQLGTLLALGWSLAHAGTALIVQRDVGPPDAIVMLASHEWERLPATVGLARLYPSSVVLLTVPRRISRSNCYRCGERADWLMSEGVSKDRIRVLPLRVQNTHDEAAATLEYFRSHPFRRLEIVSSPYHTRRALATFQQLFSGEPLDIGVFPASSTSPATPRRWWWHAYDLRYVAYEWTAILFYRVRFRVPITGRGWI